MREKTKSGKNVLRIIAIAAGASVIGCSGSSGGFVGTAEPADGGGEQDARAGQEDPDGGASIDAGDAGDTGPDTRINPIALGRTWTYDVSVIGVYPICKDGTYTGRVLGQRVVAAKSSFQVQSFCPGAGTSSYAVDGDRVELYYDNQWILLHDSPVTAGHTWTDGAFTYAWQSAGQVSVPGGTFDDCWTVRPTIGTSYTTLCRGVGPVHFHYVDAKGNGYDAQLTAYAK